MKVIALSLLVGLLGAVEPARAQEVEPAPLKRPWHQFLSAYKPNYFLLGFNENDQVKFQISLKYELWASNDETGGPHAVYLAFSERSLWRLYDKSFPFEEANYNPELFYAHMHYAPDEELRPGCGLYRERIAVEHESNGKADRTSKSLNRTYAEVTGLCAFADGNYIGATLHVWGYPWGISENPSQPDFTGPGELTLTAGREDTGRWYGYGDINVMVRKGFKGGLDKGAMQIDAKWHPSRGSLAAMIWPLNVYLYAQYFTGYGEMLSRYERGNSSFRLGLGMSDRGRLYDEAQGTKL
ncbi:MAG: phospholipase A [Myxococcota bacterium]